MKTKSAPKKAPNPPRQAGRRAVPQKARQEKAGGSLREEARRAPVSQLRSIELFAGAGGLALASANAGFSHDAVLEFNHDACETIRANQRRGYEVVRHWPLIEGDVHDQSFTSWQGRIDLVSGGPPCQPFSIGGKHRAMADRRNLFPEAARVVRETRPRAFVFENVKGLTRQSFAKYFGYIVLQLSFPDIVRRKDEEWLEHLSRLERIRTQGARPDLSYKVVWRLLNAADYGVPQKRERVFFVGIRSDMEIPWSFPQPTHSRLALLHDQWVAGNYWERHRVARRARPEAPARLPFLPMEEMCLPSMAWPLPWLTVRDAIHDLGEPARSQTSAIHPNHILQPGARSYPGHTGSPLDEPAKTLKAGDHGVPGGENMLRHPDGGVRYFSVRESCRLQTFPDEYVFEGSWTENMRQLGNAVPVRLGEVVLRSVRAAFEKHDAASTPGLF
ncbi:MAG TPA: DNA cytosine methyltransferase [Prosthecobacter sp.]|nr:DNA cytosine methyltransferase [Prosthecobacter sp.]HRK16980.1 DNA cytosine methyltransferase [Prosthecobacter sp.]